jgi:hypothetical protein
VPILLSRSIFAQLLVIIALQRLTDVHTRSGSLLALSQF